MVKATLVAVLLSLLPGLGLPRARAQGEVPFTRLYDTGSQSGGDLPPAAMTARSTWREIPAEAVETAFRGDAVLANDRLAVLLSRGAPGAGVYVRGADAYRRRATLAWSPSRGAADRGRLLDWVVTENSPTAVAVSLVFAARPAPALRCRITVAEPIIEMGAAAGRVTAATTAPYVVVPDYFGDDLVCAPVAGEAIPLPAENFCISLIAGGRACMMTVWEPGGRDVCLLQAPAGADASACTVDLAGDVPGRLWVAFLEGDGLWLEADRPPSAAWQPAFPARWRCSWVRRGAVADSWFLDAGPAAGQDGGDHAGPAIVYALDRDRATPLTALCPTDVMRNTLGVGPCQYILSVEGMDARANPTPDSVLEWVEKQFARGKAATSADEIAERLGHMEKHLLEARARIEAYGSFAERVAALAAGAAPQPGAETAAAIAADIRRFVADGTAPHTGENEVALLVRRLNDLARGDEGDAEARCRQAGARLRAVGAARDAALARCRMGVRRLHLWTGGRPDAAGGQDPAMAEIHALAAAMLGRRDPGRGDE